MASVNKTILIGRVGQDPTTNTMENSEVSNFSVATTEKYKKKDSTYGENTEWHNIVAWNGLSKLVSQYVKKGDQIYVEGKLTYEEYTDKEGATKKVAKIIASSITLLGGGKSEGGKTSKSEKAQEAEEDLPY